MFYHRFHVSAIHPARTELRCYEHPLWALDVQGLWAPIVSEHPLSTVMGTRVHILFGRSLWAAFVVSGL